MTRRLALAAILAAVTLAGAGWAGTHAVYTVPALQLGWMLHYARGRFGSIEAAAAQWTVARSW